MIATINPATGELLRQFESLTPETLEAKLARAATAAAANRQASPGARSEKLRRVAQLLESRKGDYGRLITTEMGKPLKAAIAEVEKCAGVCTFYAEHGAAFLADEKVPTDASESFIRYQPLGTILAVMPWNFPFWQVFRFAAPALMAGNVGLLKHSSNVPQCALTIEEVLHDAGFDHGEFQTLLIAAAQVTAIIEDERVKAVTLTGSEAAGGSVAGTAAGKIKKSVLELGGSDPFIVMPSADLATAVRVGVKARVVNNGQSCIAAKRFIVHQKVAAKFQREFVAAMEALRVGDPMDESTDIGPLAMPQIVDDIERQVRDSIAAGARLLTGGKRLGTRGNFYAPTVLSDLPSTAPAACDETFGPVAAIIVVRDTEHAIRVANDTPFGLGSSVWTRDRSEANLFLDRLEAGQVFVNAMVASDARMPFGGVKRSGFGRELGIHGIREFVNIKSVWIAGEMSTPTNTE